MQSTDSKGEIKSKIQDVLLFAINISAAEIKYMI
jgi:hypothetical protein